MAASNYTGVLERVDLKSRKPFGYQYGREVTEFYLDCLLRLEDGTPVYFKTPAVRESIASCPVAAVVLYHIPPSVEPWVEEVGTNKVARPNVPNDNQLVPKVKVGDTVAIRGSLKADKVSARGTRYLVLNRVTRLS